MGVDRPRVAFSDVLSFDLNGEAIHIVRQAPGYSDADTITHFHVANLVYLGEVFPGYSYPTIDHTQGGTLDGLVKTLDEWTDSKFRVVPARGEVTNGESIKAFRDMIVTVRARIKRMIKDGRTEAQVAAHHPTTEYDRRWGHGRVAPEVFAAEMYRELTSKPRSGDLPLISVARSRKRFRSETPSGTFSFLRSQDIVCGAIVSASTGSKSRVWCTRDIAYSANVAARCNFWEVAGWFCWASAATLRTKTEIAALVKTISKV